MVNGRPTCVDQRLGTTGVFRCRDFGIYLEARGWMWRLRIQMDEVGHNTPCSVHTDSVDTGCWRALGTHRAVDNRFVAGDGVEEALLGNPASRL